MGLKHVGRGIRLLIPVKSGWIPEKTYRIPAETHPSEGITDKLAQPFNETFTGPAAGEFPGDRA